VKLGDISARQKKYDEALGYYQQARKSAPYTHPPKVLLAVASAGNGDIEKATSLLREARAESPDYPVPALILGQLASRQQDTDTARECLASAASLPLPDNWPESHKKRFMILLHTERFRLAQQLNDLELARNSLTQWLKYDPGNSQVQGILRTLPAARAP
jgi:tetratricopeptide (TPR) repeat protein